MRPQSHHKLFWALERLSKAEKSYMFHSSVSNSPKIFQRHFSNSENLRPFETQLKIDGAPQHHGSPAPARLGPCVGPMGPEDLWIGRQD